MDNRIARTMVENLSICINPLTRKALPQQDCYPNGIVQDAIKAILKNYTIESYATMLVRKRKETKKSIATKRCSAQNDIQIKEAHSLAKKNGNYMFFTTTDIPFHILQTFSNGLCKPFIAISRS